MTLIYITYIEIAYINKIVILYSVIRALLYSETVSYQNRVFSPESETGTTNFLLYSASIVYTRIYNGRKGERDAFPID